MANKAHVFKKDVPLSQQCECGELAKPTGKQVRNYHTKHVRALYRCVNGCGFAEFYDVGKCDGHVI